MTITLILLTLFGQSIDFKGKKRNYVIKLPQARPPKMGIVVGLHCAGGNPQEQIAKWEKIVTADGCIMVAPESVSTWKDAEQDGFEYIKAVIEDVARQYPIDRSRVILVGYSAGACHACRIGIPNSDYFTGVIAYAGASGQGFGHRAIPVALIHGTADKAVNFATAERLAKELEAKGWPLFFKPIQGGGHEYNASFDREAWEFVKKHRQVPPEEYIERGRAAMKSKKWKEAYKHFNDAKSAKDIEELLAIGEKELAAADTPAKRKKVAQAWEGTPVGDKAKE